MAVKIKDYITRDTKTLMSTFNTMPKLECVIQNQRLMLEVTCDVRKELLEVLNRLSWLGSTKPVKHIKIKRDKEEEIPKLSRKAEAALSLEERVKLVSARTAKEEAVTKDEDVEAF